MRDIRLRVVDMLLMAVLLVETETRAEAEAEFETVSVVDTL